MVTVRSDGTIDYVLNANCGTATVEVTVSSAPILAVTDVTMTQANKLVN